MKNLGTSIAIVIFAAVLLFANVAAAEEKKPSNWSINFTPVLILPSGDEGLGGGVDPEMKYTLDLGDARLSIGGRLGAYYAKNLFSWTLMPTLRLMVPMGSFEPYASVGLGYGWLPDAGREGVAAMGRLGFVYRFSERFAIGLEGTLQQVDGSSYRFASFGSMVSFHL